MLKKQTNVEIEEDDDEDLPEDYVSIGAFCFFGVIPMMGWMISMTRWWYFGISVKEIGLTLSPQKIGLVVFIMSILIAGIGVLITWKEPTVANFCINIAFPFVFVCALFTAEKNFILTCIIIFLSVVLSVVWGIRTYLVWEDRKYLSSERRRYERFRIFMRVRGKVLRFLALGVVPWAFGIYFCVPDIPEKHPQYSKESDFSHTIDKSKYHFLDSLDNMWSGYPAGERLLAVNELAAYECERLGVASVQVETEKKKEDKDTRGYDSGKNRIVLDESLMNDGMFADVVFEVVSSCRYKYQKEFADCMKELETKGKYVSNIPDFSETYKIVEAEQRYEKGEISRKEYTDVIYRDAVNWRETEVEYLKKEFGWELKESGETKS